MTFRNPNAVAAYVSNIIIATSDETFDTQEEAESVAQLPLLTSDSLPVPLTLSKPTGDFSSVGGGEYVGNASGQKLLQTIDTTAAVAKFGATSKVSHLVVYGNPGYRVGSAVTSATGISKLGNEITLHGNHILNFEKDTHIYDVWKIADGSKFSDIDGLQVGWRAGE